MNTVSFSSDYLSMTGINEVTEIQEDVSKLLGKINTNAENLEIERERISNCVKNFGDESIDGVKTFTDTLIVEGDVLYRTDTSLIQKIGDIEDKIGEIEDKIVEIEDKIEKNAKIDAEDVINLDLVSPVAEMPILNVHFTLYNINNGWSNRKQWLAKAGSYDNANKNNIYSFMFPYRWKIDTIIASSDGDDGNKPKHYTYNIWDLENEESISTSTIEWIRNEDVKSVRVTDCRTIEAGEVIRVQWHTSSYSYSEATHEIWGYQVI